MAQNGRATKLELAWETRKRAPFTGIRGVSVSAAHGNTVYFNPDASRFIHGYNVENEDWTTLPECPHFRFGLACINGAVTAIGGVQPENGRATNSLLSIADNRETKELVWLEKLRPMPTARFWPAVIHAHQEKILVVAGGKTDTFGPSLSTVEVMRTDTEVWFTASSLPEPMCQMMGATSEAYLYFLGGRDKIGVSQLVFTCSLALLLQSCQLSGGAQQTNKPHTSVWRRVADVPVFRCTCIAFQGSVLTVGGRDLAFNPAAALHMYNRESDSWFVAGHMDTARWESLVATSPQGIVAVGGWTLKGLSANVEVGLLGLSDEARHLAAFEMAIREKGSLEMILLQSVFMGLPRAGKSSLMKRLTGHPPNPEMPSTGVAEKVLQVEIRNPSFSTVNISELGWIELEFDDEAIALMMEASRTLGQQQAPSQQSATLLASDGSSMASADELMAEADTESSHSSSQMLAPEVEVQSQSSPAHKHPKLPTSFKPPMEMLKQALRNKKWSIAKQYIEGATRVYFTDTGGQIEFQELFPALISGPSIFILVFKLNQDLNERFTIEYQHSSGIHSEPYQSSFTVKEALLQSLASIASMGAHVYRQQHQQSVAVPVKPKVLFVGTHSDKVSKERIQEINQSLQELIKYTPHFKEIVQYASPNQLVLAVNNLAPDDSDIDRVRQAVQRLGSWEEFRVRAPTPWLVFSLALRQLKEHPVLEYEECFAVARECGIDTQMDLDEALWFLHHRVGLLRHFVGKGLEELKDIVIQDPKILFKVITKLIVGTFTFQTTPSSVLQNFKEKAIFPYQAFENLSRRDSEGLAPLTPRKLVMLLEHLRIIAPLHDEDGETQYFMPCLLQYSDATEPRESPLHMHPAPLPPLLVTFRGGYCPKGIFGALVVYLLTKKTQSEFDWELDWNQMFKDRVYLLVDVHDAVCLRVLSTHLEVTLHTKRASSSTCSVSLQHVCCEVRETVKSGLKEVTSTLHYDAKCYAEPQLAFYCPSCSTEPHPAVVKYSKSSGRPKYLSCTRATQRCEIPSEWLAWLENPSTSDHEEYECPPPEKLPRLASGSSRRDTERPVSLSAEDLLEVAQQVGTDSFRLGVLLGITPEEMEQLYPHSEPWKRNMDILRRWQGDYVEGQQPPERQILAQVLLKMGHGNLAHEIEPTASARSLGGEEIELPTAVSGVGSTLDQFDVVSLEVGERWEELATRLGLSRETVASIKQKDPRAYVQAFWCLWRWRGRGEHSLQQLARALRQSHMARLAARMENTS